jgi:hypothetical protein
MFPFMVQKYSFVKTTGAVSNLIVPVGEYHSTRSLLGGLTGKALGWYRSTHTGMFL